MDFGEGAWSSRRHLASLQDYDAKIRGQWRLVKTWVIHELPNRAPPVPELVLQSMVGWGLYHSHFAFATSLLVCFYGALRTGELLDVSRNRVEISAKLRTAVIALGLTKAGKRAGTQESVSLGHDRLPLCTALDTPCLTATEAVSFSPTVEKIV